MPPSSLDSTSATSLVFPCLTGAEEEAQPRSPDLDAPLPAPHQHLRCLPRAPPLYEVHRRALCIGLLNLV